MRKPTVIIRVEMGLRLAAMDEQGQVIGGDVIGSDFGYMRMLAGRADPALQEKLVAKLKEMLIGMVGANDALMDHNDFIKVPIELFEQILPNTDEGVTEREVIIGALEQTEKGTVAKIVPPDGKIH